jgi:hypothetical protein
LAGCTPGAASLVTTVFNGFLAAVRFQLLAAVNTLVGMKGEVRSRVGLHILEARLVAQHIQGPYRIQPKAAARIREAVGSRPHLENTGGHKDQDGNLAGKHMALRTRSARAR